MENLNEFNISNIDSNSYLNLNENYDELEENEKSVIIKISIMK